MILAAIVLLGFTGLTSLTVYNTFALRHLKKTLDLLTLLYIPALHSQAKASTVQAERLTPVVTTLSELVTQLFHQIHRK